jgi:hypothetical protein
MSNAISLPLVSAIIPTHKRPTLLLRAVRSALGQTYKNLEVIVVIDGVEPETATMLAELHDPRLKTITLEQNRGGNTARNIGISTARGEWIALLDDDDEWMPEKISAQYAAYLDHGNRNCIVVCDYIARRIDDTLVHVRAPHPDEYISDYMFYSDRVFRSSLGHLPVADCYFASKHLFLQTPFTPNLPNHQDWDWLLRTMSCPDRTMVVVNKPLAIVNCSVADDRISMTTNWRTSLQWVDASSHLFTSRSYSGFVTDVCMRRIAEVKNRARIFLLLIERCNKRGRLTFPQTLNAIKWFFLAPSIRRSKFVRSMASNMHRQYTRINWSIQRLLLC